jgi:predicted  nucleic acid-binding Zn-ribbon protein|tara:strand:- start:5345 stop:5923 length:579 start_codon:yes stop_codon:yes gene_type:complete
MLQIVRQHRALAGVLIANAGVAVSMLYGGFSFISTYEQTQADVLSLHEQVDQLVRHDQLEEVKGQLGDATRDIPHLLERATRLEEQVSSNNSSFDLDRIKSDLDVIKERVVFVESQLHNAQGSQDALRQLDARLDELDDAVVIWDQQAATIMVEHEQLGDIVEDIYARLDELSGDRTRVQLPAGSQRGYGYD